MIFINVKRMHKVLVTCPPMLGMMDIFIELAKKKYNFELIAQNVTQTMSEEDLIKIIKNYDGWIIGDDPATTKVFKEGKKGNLKAAVKWGVGIDNVDIKSAKDLNIEVRNTPGLFGEEVADLAHCYLICLSRNIVNIHNDVLKGEWPKYIGQSLQNKIVGLVGYGDIGKSLVKRLLASGMNIQIYDPFINDLNLQNKKVYKEIWPNNIDKCDFVILTCSLNKSNYHLINKDIFDLLKRNVKIINVSRGQLIDEKQLLKNLESGKVHSAALDVFEKEPLPINSKLKNYKNCIFGTHNGSNTKEAVEKASIKALEIMNELLN